METIDIISLASALGSLILSVVAIWLSIVFFKMSSQLSESTKEASKGIGASVDRLEKLFDKLYSDTFSMMKDTVSDMRKHMWPDNPEIDDQIVIEAEKKADEKVEYLKKTMEEELSKMLRKQKITDEKLDSVNNEMRSLLERAIDDSRKLEITAREETMRQHILTTLRQSKKLFRGILVADIFEKILEYFPTLTGISLINELSKLKQEGLILTSEERIGPSTEIRLA